MQDSARKRRTAGGVEAVPKGLAGADRSPPSLARVYDRIRSGLLAGEWRGGDTLSETVLARELKVSRTPVREAIRKLEAEGFLFSLPRRGTVVRRPTRQDVLELFQLREALETLAVAEVAPVVTEAQLGEMRKLLGQMAATRQRAAGLPEVPPELAQAHAALDAEFHLVVLRATGNRRLLKAVADCRIMTQLLGFPKDQARGRAAQWAVGAAEHQAILEALERRDAEAARACMARHLCIARERALAFHDVLEKRQVVDSLST